MAWGIARLPHVRAAGEVSSSASRPSPRRSSPLLLGANGRCCSAWDRVNRRSRRRATAARGSGSGRADAGGASASHVRPATYRWKGTGRAAQLAMDPSRARRPPPRAADATSDPYARHGRRHQARSWEGDAEPRVEPAPRPGPRTTLTWSSRQDIWFRPVRPPTPSSTRAVRGRGDSTAAGAGRAASSASCRRTGTAQRRAAAD